MWATLDKILSDCADYHLPAYAGVFALGSTLAWFHRLDPTFVTFAGMVISAVAGHSVFGKKNGDDQGNPA